MCPRSFSLLNGLAPRLSRSEWLKSSPPTSTGYTLRFPRVVKIREDKSAADCMTVDGLLPILTKHLIFVQSSRQCGAILKAVAIGQPGLVMESSRRGQRRLRFERSSRIFLIRYPHIDRPLFCHRDLRRQMFPMWPSTSTSLVALNFVFSTAIAR